MQFPPLLPQSWSQHGQKNQAWEHRLALAAWHLCPPAWEQRQNPVAGIPGAGLLACFGCQLPSTAFQKAPARPRCQQAASARALSLE